MQSDDTTKTFWQRLCDAYADKNKGARLTQGEAAKLIRATQGTGKKWAHGGKPRMTHAIALADKLGVCVEWLLTGRSPKRPLTQPEYALVELFRKLPDDLTRGEVIGQIKAHLPSPPLEPRRKTASR